MLRIKFLSSPFVRDSFNCHGLRPCTQVGDEESRKKHVRLGWLMVSLSDIRSDNVLFHMYLLVDELLRLIESDPAIKALITPTVAEIIEDLTIACECARQLDLCELSIVYGYLRN